MRSKVPSDRVARQLRSSFLLLSLAFTMPLAAQAVQLEVQFKLTDLDYRPLAGEPVRVVLGGGDWQAPEAGHAFQTDSQGEGHFTVSAALDRRWRQPHGATVSLPSLPEHTLHLMAAAELSYAGHRWLYAVDLCRFKNGDVMQDGFEVYTRDGKGRFAVKTPNKAGDWRMADLNGLALSSPGNQPWQAFLEPVDETANPPKWRLKLAFKRAPAPVMR